MLVRALRPVNHLKGFSVYKNGIRIGAAGINADAVTGHENVPVIPSVRKVWYEDTALPCGQAVQPQ